MKANTKNSGASILIIDDEELIRESLSLRVERLGHQAGATATLNEGLEALGKEYFDLVFLDVNLPDGNGLDALATIKQSPSKPEVIIITAVGSSQGAAMAIQNGAWDYITKPFSKDEIVLHIERTIEYRIAKQQQAQPIAIDSASIIGQSGRIKDCINQVAQCSIRDANVLILGETGTGKELFATAIHDNSPTISGDYVVVDCAALPDALIESVLFGYVKGAFTGADKSSAGLVKKADGGTLFLDEVGELPLSMQKTFLRVLQEKKFRPVGSSKETTSNFRLISATNRDLGQMVEEGTFRKDLFHRLKTISITLPPLRERKEDIQPLAQHYISRLSRKHAIKTKALLADTLEILEAYEWPGNVRELVNALEKAILSEPELPILYPMFIPSEIRIDFANKKLYGGKSETSEDSIDPPIFTSIHSSLSSLAPLPELKLFREQAINEIESLYLKSVFQQTDGDIDRAITISGLSKSRMYSLIKKYNLKNLLK